MLWSTWTITCKLGRRPTIYIRFTSSNLDGTSVSTDFTVTKPITDHTDIYHYQHPLAGWLAGTNGRGQLGDLTDWEAE